MAWEIKDEWINIAEGHHYVVFHNKDVMVPGDDGKPKPVEHHLVHQFKLDACPHCGVVTAAGNMETVDFAKLKEETHTKLKAHHNGLMQYREQHPKVRIGHGPKA